MNSGPHTCSQVVACCRKFTRGGLFSVRPRKNYLIGPMSVLLALLHDCKMAALAPGVTSYWGPASMLPVFPHKPGGYSGLASRLLWGAGECLLSIRK